MNSTSVGVRALGTLVFVAGILFGAGESQAANGPGKLLPTPAPSGKVTVRHSKAEPVPTPEAEEPTGTVIEAPPSDVDEGPYAYDDTECGDFSGLCSPPGRFWLRGEYLSWWTNGQTIPPLVTTSPQGTSRSAAGVLPAATVLYGLDTVNTDGHSGFRSTLGFWLDACHVWGVEFDYFNIGERDNGFAQTSTGNPILARPFFNVETNQQASELTAYPGIAEGTLSVEARDYFHSGGITLTYGLCSCDSCCDSCGDPCGDACDTSCCPALFCCRTDLLVGFRYYNLSDRVGIHEFVRDINPQSVSLGSTFDILDSFSAKNDFYGADIGLRTQIFRGRFSLDLLTRVAIGNNHETIVINGQTMIAAPSQPTQTYGSGILAGPTNTGTFQRNVFTMIPQLGLELGYQVNCHWRAFVGYDVIYWGCVARSGDQIDLNLDPRNFPPATEGGLPFPAFSGRSACFWAQGVNVGGEFRF